MITAIRKFTRGAVAATLLATGINAQAGEQEDIARLGLPQYLKESVSILFLKKPAMEAELAKRPFLHSTAMHIVSHDPKATATIDQIYAGRTLVREKLEDKAYYAGVTVGMGVSWNQAAPEKKALALYLTEFGVKPPVPAPVAQGPVRNNRGYYIPQARVR